MKTKVGINGFGRIGRNALKAALAKNADFEIVAINDITDPATLAHLLKYDSCFGHFDGTVEATADSIIVNGKNVKILAVRNPEDLPWKDLGVEVVLESTGLFTKKADAEKHIKAGAKKVIISAPATDEDITVVMGVNEDKYDPPDTSHPVKRVLHDKLPRSFYQGCRRGIRYRERTHDNGSLLYERPEDSGPAA